MKRMLACLLALLVLPALALAEGPVLLLELPQDAQMVENVAFDDGDFIQTYQLSGGARVQLLRYGAFDMTLDELVASEWVGCTNAQDLALGSIGGYPASGLRLHDQEDGQDALDVTVVLVHTGEATLVFEAVFPQALGDAQIRALVDGMIDSMDVQGGAAGSGAEVG
ncbi:MAG: hypothetical protein ACI4PG_09460 [Candidatus Ventricola sp.]